jgi:hypothetical protein
MIEEKSINAFGRLHGELIHVYWQRRYRLESVRELQATDVQLELRGDDPAVSPSTADNPEIKSFPNLPPKTLPKHSP